MASDAFRILVEENQTLRNLNPRGAYIHRFNEVIRAFIKSAYVT